MYSPVHVVVKLYIYTTRQPLNTLRGIYMPAYSGRDATFLEDIKKGI